MHPEFGGYDFYVESKKIQNRAIRYFPGVHSKVALLSIEDDIVWKACKIRQNVYTIRMWNGLILMEGD